MGDGIRISTYGSQEALRRAMGTANSELTRISKQTSSGKNAETFIELSDKVAPEEYTILKNHLSTIGARSKNNTLLKSKLNEYERSLSGLQEIASKTKKLVQDAMNPATGSSVDIVPLAKSLLGEIKSMLNTSFNGQYLFSGSKMSTAPVGDIVNNTNVFLDTPTANYYDGDEDKAKSKISEGTVMDYGVTADDGVFQKLIGSLHSLIEGSLTSDVTKITLASQWAEESTAGITPKIANVGSNMAAVESQLQIDEKLTLRLQEHLSGIEDADIVALSSEALIIETQLRATYMLMTRANSMSLADYL